jgi:hypothetical protein
MTTYHNADSACPFRRAAISEEQSWPLRFLSHSYELNGVLARAPTALNVTMREKLKGQGLLAAFFVVLGSLVVLVYALS